MLGLLFWTEWESITNIIYTSAAFLPGIHLKNINIYTHNHYTQRIDQSRYEGKVISIGLWTPPPLSKIVQKMFSIFGI